MAVQQSIRTVCCGILVGSVACFAGCDSDDAGVDDTAGVTLSDVDDSEPNDMQSPDDSGRDPSQMLGETVTIRGEVEKVFDSHTALIDDDWDDSVLVVTKDPLPAALAERGDVDDVVLQVTGVIAEYNLIELEEESGWDLQPAIEIEVEDTERMLISATAEIVAAED